jgi:hypothetical protein
MERGIGNWKSQKKSGRKFIQLYRHVKRSKEYHDLSCYARCALIELLDRYTGANNGMIGLGVRELSEEMNCSRDTASRALRELDDSGLIVCSRPGAWRGKLATEWRLAFKRCDRTQELPRHTWTKLSQSDREDTKVRQEGHKDALSTATRTQKPKSSMNVVPLSTARGTHIDIYQGLQEPEREVLAVGDPFPEIPEFLRRAS